MSGRGRDVPAADRSGRNEPDYPPRCGDGIGSGDVAARIGRTRVAWYRPRRFGAEPDRSATLRVREFEQALSALQALLRGEEVTLPGDRSSRIRWIAADAAAKVPLHVAATGPKTIAAAARHAEGVDLTVGADSGRVARGVAIAREAAPAPIQVGAYLNVAIDSDPSRARELVRGSVATFARFSAGTAELSAQTGRGVQEAADGYELDHHGEAQAGSAQDSTTRSSTDSRSRELPSGFEHAWTRSTRAESTESSSSPARLTPIREQSTAHASSSPARSLRRPVRRRPERERDSREGG